jgi:hypothetical protein
MNQLSNDGIVHCANCAAPMQGEFCHRCGQSIHSVLKPMHHMMEETAETFLHVDGRIVHTLPPLLLKPGFLTLEYFSGRRVRYIAPFRLMFVLCLLAFFVGHLALGDAALSFGDDKVTVTSEALKRATTPAQVDHELQQQLAALDRAQHLPGVGGLAGPKLDQARQELRQQALKRRAELGDKSIVMLGGDSDDATTATGSQHPDDPTDLILNAPIHIRWLPAFVNASLTRTQQHMRANIDAISGHGDNADLARERLLGELFAVLPQTMFFMLPLFAVLLKIAYLFRRRLYMEHLIVALHSHAFLFLALLLTIGLTLARAALAPHATWAAGALGWLEAALLLWMPTYLLLMQKRIYRQGWPMTVLKYLVVGYCYVFLLVFALLAALMLTLAR